MKRLEGRVALISGGLRGIGLAIGKNGWRSAWRTRRELVIDGGFTAV